MARARKLTEGAASAGDGLISAHETCISAHDFRIVAGFGKLDIGNALLDPALAADLETKISPHDLNRLLQVDKCLDVAPSSFLAAGIDQGSLIFQKAFILP